MKKIELKNNIVDDISFGAIVQIRDELLNMQREGKKVYRMESGDPSFSIPDHVKQAICEALMNNKTHYTDSTGIPELREAIAEKLRSKNKISKASSDNVFVTNGGMNALYIVFRSLLSKNDKVIIPDPMWTEINEIIKLSLGNVIHMPYLDYLDINKFKKYKNVKAIFINSPHNPTGKVLTKEAMREIINFARENGIFIVSDEAYEDVIFDGREHFSPASEYENTVSLFSMSKSYAMSGLRIGYIFTENEKLKERIKKMLRVTINGVNSATQYGALAALRGPQDIVEKMRNEYQKRRDIIYSSISNTKYLEPVFPEGAFYLWAKIKKYPNGISNEWEFSKFILKEANVGTTPGPVFGSMGTNHIRFAFSIKTEEVIEASKILEEKL
ncbi:MAG: pyridoxal phosphate-dependent aminotransferase [Thermoplasmata archaeon]